MTNIIPLRKNEPDVGQAPDSMLARELKEIGQGHLPLLQHLMQISDHNEVQEVIQLLQDIRMFQEHPEMIKAFERHDHTLAHGVKDHSKDILELLVKDYLEHNGLSENDDATDLNQLELELHVKHVVLGTLKGYQEVVEDIRSEVGDIATKLEQDESIAHVRELIGSLQALAQNEVTKERMLKLDVPAEVHHLVHGDHDDLHQVLAELAMQKGHRNHEKVTRYLKGDLHDAIREHHEDVLSVSTRDKSDSDVYVKDLVLEKIERGRQEDNRVNAAFSLLEGLREVLGAENTEMLAGQQELPDDILRVLDDPGDECVEDLIIKSTSSVTAQLKELASNVESLAGLYIAALGRENFKIRTGMFKLNQAKELKDSPEGQKMRRTVDETCHELRTILDDDTDLMSSLTRLWLENDYGNIECFEQLVDKVATDAQSYLDSDPPPGAVPFAPTENSEREKFVRRLRNATYGTAAGNVCQVIKAGVKIRASGSALNSQIEEHDEFRRMIAWFEEQGKDYREALVDYYLEQYWEGSSPEDFDQYLKEIEAKLKTDCGEKLYNELLVWRSRETIPAAPAPPSARSPRLTMPVTFTAPPDSTFETGEGVEADIKIENIQVNKIFDESNLNPEKQAFIPDGEVHSIASGKLSEVAYAMAGSTIEVEDGAKLDLFMANDDVTIKLKGDHSFVKIDRVTRNCKGLKILNKNGHAIKSGPNVELGEEVLKKLH